MKELTARQSEVLAYIREYMTDEGMPPTRAEIANKLGFRSANASEDHLKALARKGAIELIPGSSRGIKLPGPPISSGTEAANDGLAVIGKVAAGSPVLAVENVEKHLSMDPSLFSPPADYLLRVEGDSMINIGIHDGDLLAVNKTPLANQGDIVVVRIDEEVTVKRWNRVSSDHIQLIAENDDYAPIELHSGEFEVNVEGKMVGVIRQC
jgi:repressor LexA